MLDSATGQRMRNFSLELSNPYKRDKMVAMTSLSSINENGTLSFCVHVVNFIHIFFYEETAQFSSEENWIVPDFGTLPR